LTHTAKNPTTGDQITRYAYGTAKAWQMPLIYRNDMLVAEIYPDSDNFEDFCGILQNGTSGVVDRVEFLYNRVGERIAKRDQNGTIHTYEYDNFGRLLHDRVTTLGENVDGKIRRISTTYDIIGNVKSITSYDVSDNVLNEIMYEYGDNQKLAKLYQSHDGAVDIATTPYVEYNYGGVADALRLETMKYPSGKTLSYDYDTYNNVSAIKEGTTSLVQYEYNGAATPVKTTYSEPGLSLDHTNGLDRFGRITDHAWKKGATDIVHIQHGYDRAGNRLYRNDMVHSANSEVYTYDGVNQIKSLNRGSSAFTEAWNYDGTGNWLSYNHNGVVENRTHNTANEIQGTCTHDKNGNMTLMPGLKGKYDAWSRLVEVCNPSDNLIARYEYNGRNHRVRKTVDSVVTTSFFSDEWQELESVTSGQTTVFVWGLRYIDDLVCRERGGERLYSLADPNWNVVAITDDSGTVVERMRYDAFGKVTWLDAAFATKANSAYAWNRTFTGQVLDSETGLMLYRNRFYHTGLGRFITRDPIGYEAGDSSLYRYLGNRPIDLLDPMGLIYCSRLKIF
jgi:RHS repeat-associated protein